VANRERETTCLITAHETSNHNHYRYSFTVSERQYTGISQSPTGGGIVGEQMKVYFDSHDPNTNSLEDFSVTSQRDFGPLPLLAGHSRGSRIHWHEQMEGEENSNAVTEWEPTAAMLTVA
jgi:hypothetical protein